MKKVKNKGGIQMPAIRGDSNDPNVPGVIGTNTNGTGVEGSSVSSRGVAGFSTNGWGTSGTSQTNTGVVGSSRSGVGIEAHSSSNTALVATTQGVNTHAFIVHQRGSGNIITGRNNTNSDVFRVLDNGTTIVRNLIQTCDKNAKENFSDVDTLEILDKLAAIPIQSWNYKGDPASICHIGPTAQDFQAAFGLNGDDDIHISSIDLQGVALAAIQGLNEKNEKLMAENAQLHANLANLEARLSALETKG
ncbi:tail fiber domain-containing protein [Paenibacillus ehimensis]|uniref:tail fiber domain-containing protein n=1 Tax=Paenibacillus ehimensis TaxID=79264 RepID=UPI000FD8305B|nr:tail fiber domain-containing protein [Paenibacillus ehimensis]